MPLTISKAALISLFVESLVFGGFSVTYGIALWVLLVRVRRRQRGLTWQTKGLCLICTAMYVLSMAHLALSFSRALRGFVEFGGSRDLFYAHLNDPLEVSKIILCLSITVIADGFMAYRTYIVWNHNKYIIIPPAVLCIATAALGYASCARLRGLDIDPAQVIEGGLHGSIVQLILATFVLTLSGHLLSTALISGRLVWANYQLRKHQIIAIDVSVWDVLETIIQSSLLHSVSLLCLLASFLAGSWAWLILLDVTSPLLGTSFTLLITRLGLGYRNAADELRAHMRMRAKKGAIELAREEFHLQPIEIAVTVAQSGDAPGAKAYECDSGSEVAVRDGKGDDLDSEKGHK